MLTFSHLLLRIRSFTCSKSPVFVLFTRFVLQNVLGLINQVIVAVLLANWEIELRVVD
jgi:hypothetical protein